MQDGIYDIVISAGAARVAGQVALKANRLNGGAEGYRCQGRLTLAGGNLAGTIGINKRDAAAPAVLGLFKEIVVPVAGRYDPAGPSFVFEGRAYGHHVIQVAVSGTFATPFPGAS